VLAETLAAEAECYAAFPEHPNWAAGTGGSYSTEAELEAALRAMG
jgi:hypothetical protein